jgi:hypothetical protein
MPCHHSRLRAPSPLRRPRQRTTPGLASALGLSALLALGCAEDTTAPTRQGPATIEGSLTLKGTLRDPTGATTGTRVVSAPNGIRIYLLQSGADLDSALTSAGKYTFALANGTYQLRLRTGPLNHATSAEITITPQTVFERIENFEMASVGTLVCAPNPWTTQLGTRFTLAAPSVVSLGVFNLANQRVRTLVAAVNMPAGVHTVQWDGLDDASQPLADGAYWVVFSGAGMNMAELVFKGP